MKKIIVGLSALMMSFVLSSCSDGKTPYIGDNGNWWIESTDLEVPAQGPSGENGKDGQNGISVTVESVVKTSSSGLVDTYTITFSDGTTSTFTVTNGEANSITGIELTSSSGNVDTYTISFSNGSTKTFTVTNGANGDDLTITSIEQKSSEGLIDTYVINYSDGSKFEFVVSNGADGQTPYIGDNGNWWIGDTDTGVLADYEKAQNVPLTDLSDGLTYEAVTIGGKSGFVVSSWDDELFQAIHHRDREPVDEHLVIPNYIGGVPVIGVKRLFSDDCASKITLSKNTIYLWEGAFRSNEALVDIDFNSCPLKIIAEEAFVGTGLKTIELPSSVIRVEDKAFSGLNLKSANVGHLKYIGSDAFNGLYAPYVYLPNTVEYVGSNAFGSTRVYIEHETLPTTWGSNIAGTSDANSHVKVNCKRTDKYIYSINENEATVYQYLGKDRSISLPSTICGYPLKTIGYGFGSVAYCCDKVWSDRYNSTGDVKSIVDLDEIEIPEGVTKIDDFALIGTGTFIKIPSSIETVSETLLQNIDPDDFNIILPELNIICASNYLAFKGSEMPVVLNIFSDTPDTYYTKETVLNSYFRISFDNDFSKIENDDGFYYYRNINSYSLIAYMGLRTTNLVVPSNYNNKNVTTVLRCAIPLDLYLEKVTFESGITTIRSYAVVDDGNLKSIFIPNTVSIINQNGIYIENTSHVFVQSDSKPMDWDSNWINVPDFAIFGVDATNDFFAYAINSNKITLVKYIGASLNVFIPNEIDGKVVSAIKSNFFTIGRGADIYIPSSISTIDSGAFITAYGKQYNFYCEASEKPSTWDSQWVSGNGTKSTYWNQSDLFDFKYNDSYVYRIVEDAYINLCAFGGNQFIINIPRIIENKPVTSIEEYCFEFNKKVIVYIPKEITTIDNYSFDSTTTDDCYINCEIDSKPSGWATYWCYNSRYSSMSHFVIQYNQTFDY